MRTAFIQELIAIARRNPRIFLVVGDLGFSVVEPFAREFPDRYLNAGVAEQNMTGVAAGLASEGYHVFTYSIANFPTFRCAEQIRNDVAYHGLPVTVVAVGGGLAYGNLGYSHHAVQDIALMRSFPGLTLACPGDPEETRACLRYLCEHPCPSYLRLGKAGEPAVHAAPVETDLGAFLQVRGAAKPGTKAILTTAAALHLAATALTDGHLAQAWTLHSLPLWNEQSKPTVMEFVRRHESVITVEDHLRAGGFGAFVQESLDGTPELLGRVRCLALDSAVCGQVASQARLNELGGLTAARLHAVMAEALP
jgi:transketolase